MITPTAPAASAFLALTEKLQDPRSTRAYDLWSENAGREAHPKPSLSNWETSTIGAVSETATLLYTSEEYESPSTAGILRRFEGAPWLAMLTVGTRTCELVVAPTASTEGEYAGEEIEPKFG